MPEWIFQGTLTLSGVDVYIIADNEEEAIAKAKAGKSDSWDMVGAESVGRDIDPDSGKLNE